MGRRAARRGPVRYLLDTTVIVEHAAGDSGAVGAIASLFEETSDLYACDVVTCEALSGGTDEERAVIRRFLDALEFVALGPAEARLAGELRRAAGRGSGRSLGDALVGALAIALGATVVTRNRPDFARMGVPVREY